MLLKLLPSKRQNLCVVTLVLMLGLATGLKAQVFELRHTFERFESGKILIGGELTGPNNSELDPNNGERQYARVNTPFNIAAQVNGYLSIDYWQLRAGLKVNMLSAIAPFIFWNPVIGDKFGGEQSRWSGSIGWEGIFASDADFDPRKNLQADNSVYSPSNSFSIMAGYWFGKPGKTLTIDTNYWGRGFVDTSDYRTPPLDTNSYVRGNLLPSEVPSAAKGPQHFSSRNGFSAAIGLGTGKYAGSGPISKYLNFLYPSQAYLDSNPGIIKRIGLNPMGVLRYRYNDYIAEAEVAGEDVDLGLIYRGFNDFDLEGGFNYLEHLFYRPSRGPNRVQLFVGVRWAPLGPGTYETGDQVYDPKQDSDGDGIPDGIERTVTFTDPNNADTDGDGLPDGMEVYVYKTNPLVKDSDGDGLTDGQEVNGQRRTDPLRSDTDGDGISDGEEVRQGTDPLEPGTGIRGR